MPGSPVCLAVSGSEGRDQAEHNYSSDQGIQVGEIDTVVLMILENL